MGRSDISLESPPETQPPASARRDWRRIAPGLIISLLALAAVFYFADFRRLVQALRMANYALLLLGVLVSLSWLFVRAKVWRTLLQDKAPYKTVFLTLNETYLINNLLPLRLGEIAGAFLLSRKSSLAFWQVISSIVIERAMDLALAVGLVLVSLPFVVGGSWAQEAAVGAGLLVLMVFVVLYLLARFREQVLAVFMRMGKRWPVLLRLGGNALPAFFNGLAVLTDVRVFLRASAWMLLNWGIALLQYYLIMAAYFPSPSLLWAVFTLGVSALGVAAPSSPGALGVMELSIVGSLSVFGLDPSAALAFAFTLHITQYLTTGVIGGYALFRDGESLAGIYTRMRGMRASDPEDMAG
jgi:glycosyltransferase 2 family protein